MKTIVSALLFVFACMLAAPVEAQPARASLSGEWRGVYFQGPDNEAIEFTARLTDQSGRITGTIIEPNMFGDASSYWLFSTLTGRVESATIRFAKTYDGTAGQSHAVQYEGRVLSDRRIIGVWSLAGASGQFEMGR